jgi:hypothetical protein
MNFRTAVLFLALLASPVLSSAADAEPPAAAEDASAGSAIAEDSSEAGAEDSDETSPQLLARQHYQTGRYALLSRSERPRDRAFAAVLPLVEEAWPPPSLVLMEAAAAAPEDVLVQWIYTHASPGHAQSCQRSGPDETRSAGLLRLEPDNAAAQLLRLGLAQEQADELAVDAALAAMAAAKRFDIHFLDLVEAGIEQFERYPLPDDLTPFEQRPGRELSSPAGRAAVVHVQAVAQAAMLMPAYQPLLQVCHAKKQAAASPQRYAACGDIARLMVVAPTVIDRSFGYLILRNSGQITPAEAVAGARHRWLAQHIWTVFETGGPEAEDAFARVYRQSRDETTALEYLVQHYATAPAATD